MYVVYKVSLNEREQDKDFPLLYRFFKREIVMENVDNPHLEVAKLRMNNNEEGITYSVGVVK